MKRSVMLSVCICLSFLGRAQWSDTTNKFTDTLHMQVTSAPYNQGAPLVVRSYPDSGYFVIWQDSRNDRNNSITAIYAQKYSKAGVAQWAANGVPVSAGTNKQHYTYGGQDYRNRSYAATDSAGGFYIAYADDSSSTYIYQRACVQHVKSDGKAVFGGPGHILYTSTSANLNVSPQLIADGSGGFFYSFGGAGTIVGTFDILYVFCYKEVADTLQYFGGGQVNQNGIEQIVSGPCGNYATVNYVAAEVNDYNIFPDLQGGCNIVMSLNINSANGGNQLGYNKLFRAKKTSAATEYNYEDSGDSVAVMPGVVTYRQGNVYPLYYLRTSYHHIVCGSVGGDVYTENEYRLVQNGFEEIDGPPYVYDLNDPKGVTIRTDGNINATLLAAWKRTYSQSTGVSDPRVEGYVLKEEVYDSIPYQRASGSSPLYPGYNTTEPASLNKLDYSRDTILAAPFNYDFSLTGGSNQIFSSAVTIPAVFDNFTSEVRLQHLAIERQSADSFALVYKTSTKIGELIGKDKGDTRYGTEYDIPFVQVNNNGAGLFSVKDNLAVPGSSPRVSPVFTGAKLAWGAMGSAIGTGRWNDSYYDQYSPVVSLDPANGTALIAWTDGRNNGTTGYDIYMRHIDDLNNTTYAPPYTRVKPVNNPFGPPTSSAVLYGTTNALTTISVFDGSYTTEPGTSPVVAISDNYNLGNVTVKVYDNTGGIRTSADGKPYLDRSYTITPDNNPNGAATLTVRLFFTTAEFVALQAADTSIHTLGDLAVVKQPSGFGSGSTYTIVPGESTIPVQSWAAVDGGYYINIQVTSFSNFFIFKNPNAVFPLTWLGIQAQWQNAVQANVSWQVAEQVNVKSFVVQHSTDGSHFTDVYSVTASAQTQYSCTVPAGGSRNYYRVVETGTDGRKTYSPVAELKNASPVVFLYPNPAKNVLYVKGIGNYSLVQIIDMQGKVVQQQQVTSANQPLNIGSLSKGNYLLKLVSKTDLQTLKFSKE